MDDGIVERGFFMSDDINFLNLEFSGDISKLKNAQEVLRRITSYEKELERQINPYNLDHSHLINYTKNAENAVIKIKEMKAKCDELRLLAEDEEIKMSPMCDHFAAHVRNIKELENFNNYLHWILKIEGLNSQIEEALKNSISSQTVLIYTGMKDICEELQVSDCKNLVEYVQTTMLYWHDLLKEKFGREFHKVLGSLHWPVLTTNVSMPLPQLADVLKFKELFLTLYKIQLPYAFVKINEGKSFEVSSVLLPLQFMIHPLQKRFIFHFMSKKPTNRLDKPEWYLTQILSWISNHIPFIEQQVQPFLDKEGIRTEARVAFMQGLVHLAILRLELDLPSVVNDDGILSHTIDEVLLFAHELQNQGYPKSSPSILQLLITEPCFTRWRSLEHQSALEKMDKFLNSDTAWHSRYQNEGDLDDFHVPESAEYFITLLLTMTERYTNLTEKECQLSFLDLQLELVDDFRLRLHQLSQCPMEDTTHSCGIINAIYYIVTVLEQWNNLPVFLQLFAYKRKKKSCQELLKDCGQQRSYIVKLKDSKHMFSTEEEMLKSSVFDETIVLYEHMQKDLLQTLSDRVILDIKAKSRAYRKERWFCISPVQDKTSLEVSQSAYPVLEIINSSLHTLQELLAKPLFTKVWQQVSTDLDVYLYEEVILQNNFSEGGAAQLNFDMGRNLFPIFGCYTLKPDSYFKLVKDSCLLLNLMYAPAMLLKETLHQEEDFKTKSNALEELGVFTLSPSEALLILCQRNYTKL